MDNLVCNELSTDSLTGLISGTNLCAIRKKCFLDNQLSSRLAQWFLNSDLTTPWLHEHYTNGSVIFVNYGVNRIGTPFNLTYGKGPDSEEKRKYYEDAPRITSQIRAVCEPDEYPIDTVCTRLNELWPEGAKIAEFENKKMFAGIGRITMADHKHSHQPHFDSLPAEFGLARQFSINVYLSVPPSGGELELWNYHPLSPEEISKTDQDMDWRSKLPPSFFVSPEIGELIMFDTRRPHAVKNFDKGSRVTLQVFLGYIPGKPLMLWS
nr:2OG-Fe(II) oxygenase [Endozoicomonas sp.]